MEQIFKKVFPMLIKHPPIPDFLISSHDACLLPQLLSSLVLFHSGFVNELLLSYSVREQIMNNAATLLCFRSHIWITSEFLLGCWSDWRHLSWCESGRRGHMCESLHHKDFFLVFAVNKMGLLGCSVFVSNLLLLYYLFYHFSSTYRFTKCSESSLLQTI